MKKIRYSILAAGALLLMASCAEDKGTSTEVVSANADENVNPNHIRGYAQVGTAGSPAGGGASRPATGRQADAEDAIRLVWTYYNDQPDLTQLEQVYSPETEQTPLTGGEAIEGGNTTPSNFENSNANRGNGNSNTVTDNEQSSVGQPANTEQD